MPQRPEDYQSTKNVGGKKLGGTGAGHNDPFDYVKTTKDHDYLGHFNQEKFIREGHNTVARMPQTGVKVASAVPQQPANVVPRVDIVGGAPQVSTVFPAPPMTQTPPGVMTPAPSRPLTPTISPGLQTPTRRALARAEHPVIAARRQGRQAVRAAQRLGPDAPGMAGARRVAVADAKTARRAAVLTARANPNSAYSEARARRATRGIY